MEQDIQEISFLREQKEADIGEERSLSSNAITSISPEPIGKSEDVIHFRTCAPWGEGGCLLCLCSDSP
jgi:hypothetical protein